MMRLAVMALAWLLAAAAVLARDERQVSADSRFDFSTIRTFAIRPGSVASGMPEFESRLFRQKLEEAVRLALVDRGLKETADRPDAYATFSVATREFTLPANRSGTGSRGRGRGGASGTGPIPDIFVEGSLIVDVTHAQTRALLWRGTCRDEERGPARLSRNLPVDVLQLLSKYPSRK